MASHAGFLLVALGLRRESVPQMRRFSGNSVWADLAKINSSSYRTCQKHTTPREIKPTIL
jgi:hypothetical protein